MTMIARCVASAMTLIACIVTHAEGPVQIPASLQAAEQSRIDAIARAMPSAVCVFVPGGGGGGSGMLISPDGFALTNFHVTSPAGTFMRCGLSDGNVYDAVIVGIDPVGDLAMIRLIGLDGKTKNDFPVATFGSSRTAQPGDWCMVIGNPFLLATNLQPTVTYGILSGVGRYQYPSGTLLEYGDCLQTDASINPGNSGGPIYDAEGKLLGIVGRCSFEKRGRVNVGVGYAISINQAENFLGVLRSGRIVDHATLGATVATDPDGGVRVTNILESSDAYRRGLRYGAEILEIDGRVVQTANDLQNVLATFPAGWRIPIRFRIDGNSRDTLVRLASVHGPDELLEKMAGALPPPPPREEPKPEDNEDNEGDDSDGEQESAPEDQEPDSPHGKSPIPKSVTDQLIERKGYANYHFNEREQDDFIAEVRNQYPAQESSESNEPTGWIIEGETADGDASPVMIRVTSGKMAMIVGERPVQIETKGELYEAVTRRSPVGMLAALDAWRRMLATGPKQFGETFYWGTMPLGGQRPLRDCVVGIDGEMETRWLSHPDSHALEAVEVFADRDEDPAELWLLRDGADAKAMPTFLDLRYGTESLLKVKVKSWKLVPESELDAENQ
ncbi:putative serine protease HhoB precursor [Rubripirellula reticaptiva]|uniref:Putative serine protease HhoB n=2 Tax=Rubripirellula reticaptiva TaxID=2528013 RepID=A0A5C6EFS6_9BACT|nr:trypsin-like peptidase domain-containing protein [Rubripirellula reticaptiva]TWU47812.1 putative serine protease HhoB precursor [Rubripirellula reticaptiva]